MNRIAYDAEFVEDGTTVEMLSLALVAENGDSYYAVSNDAWTIQRAVENEWLRTNVVPGLPLKVGAEEYGMRTWSRGFRRYEFANRWEWDRDHADFRHVKSRAQIAHEVRGFVLSFPAPQLWSWFGAYDHVVVCQLFGSMVDLPAEFPMFTCDIEQERVRLGVPESDLPRQREGHHSAQFDVQHHWAVIRHLDQVRRLREEEHK